MGKAISPTPFPFMSRLSPLGQDEARALRLSRARAGQQLLQRGDPAGGAYLIVGGSLRAYYLTEGGREATLYRVETGGTCILALSSAINDEPYPAWVDAGPEGGQFVQVPQVLLRRWLEREPAFRDYVFGVLSGRVFELMQVLEESGSMLMEQRVARFILRRADPSGLLKITQAGLAAELGTAREVVSRAVRALVARGLIQSRRGHVQILDRHRLSSH